MLFRSIWIGGVAASPASLAATQSLIDTDPDASATSLYEAATQDIAALDIADDEEARADYRRHLAATVALRAIAGCREDLRR